MANPTKASSRIALNTRLIALTFSIFFLTINLRQELFSQKIVLLQLILAIPLLLTSTLAYSKVSYRERTNRWEILSWITFVLGYSFLLNIVGILVGNIAGVLLATIFFVASWILTLTYSLIDISYNKSVIKERLVKDGIFILIQLTFGLLVVLKLINF